MSVVTAHMVYFCAFACSEIFQKDARKSGVGRGQFDAGVNGLSMSECVLVHLYAVVQFYPWSSCYFPLILLLIM